MDNAICKDSPDNAHHVGDEIIRPGPTSGGYGTCAHCTGEIEQIEPGGPWVAVVMDAAVEQAVKPPTDLDRFRRRLAETMKRIGIDDEYPRHIEAQMRAQAFYRPVTPSFLEMSDDLFAREVVNAHQIVEARSHDDNQALAERLLIPEFAYVELLGDAGLPPVRLVAQAEGLAR